MACDKRKWAVRVLFVLACITVIFGIIGLFLGCDESSPEGCKNYKPVEAQITSDNYMQTACHSDCSRYDNDLAANANSGNCSTAVNNEYKTSTWKGLRFTVLGGNDQDIPTVCVQRVPSPANCREYSDIFNADPTHLTWRPIVTYNPSEFSCYLRETSKNWYITGVIMIVVGSLGLAVCIAMQYKCKSYALSKFKFNRWGTSSSSVSPVPGRDPTSSPLEAQSFVTSVTADSR